MKSTDPVSVLHIITRMIVGGAQENTMFTASLLNRNSFKVDLITGPQTGPEGSLLEESIDRGINLIIMPELVREINPLKDIRAFFKLYRFISKGKYQIVHTHSSKAGILGRLAAYLAKTPIIIHTIHGWSFHNRMPSLKKKIYIFLERWIASFTKVMIVVTSKDKAKGLSEKISFPDKYLLIRSAIPLDDFIYKTSDRQKVRKGYKIPLHSPVLGNVGRFSSQKNPLEWIKIAGIIARKVPNCYFLLVGDGPLYGQVMRQCQEEKILDRTRFTGLQRNVSKFMSAMDVFLMTSLWEGLPRVIPEAMSIGLPIVAYCVDGIEEVIEHGKTGYLSSPGNIEESAQFCISLLENPILQKQIMKNSQTFLASEFNLKTMICQLENLYLSLVKKDSIEYE